MRLLPLHPPPSSDPGRREHARAMIAPRRRDFALDLCPASGFTIRAGALSLEQAVTREDVQRWLNRYGAAWETGDPDAAAALFSDDASYRETPFDEPMVGKAEIRRYWQEGAADAQTDVTFSAQVWAVDGDLAIAGWQARFTRKPSGARVELDGVFRLVFARAPDGARCSGLEEWWHRRES
jgi:uncharacterized protein (TIGR02246 family)